MTVIQLTDGTTTLNLYDSASYMVIDQSWSPAVSARQHSPLGFPYLPIEESMQLMITGTSVSDCLDKWATLAALIDQADRWWLGADVAAVTFKYQPGGSGLTNPVQATVLGSPMSAPALTTPPRVEWVAHNDYKLAPIGLQFRRLGAWLGDEESDSSGSSNNPAALSVTNTATDLPSPAAIQLSNFRSTWFSGSFLVVTDDADKIEIFTAAGLTATGWTDQADASKKPLQGTNVLLYTPTGTAWSYCGQKDIVSLLLSDTREVAIYINAVIVSSGMEALVKARIEPNVSGSSAIQDLETRPIQLESGTNNPQWYYLGTISLPLDLADATNQYLQIACKTDNTTSTVAIDAICLVDTRNIQSVYLPINEVRLLTDTLILDHALLTKTEARHYMNTLNYTVSTRGTRGFMAYAAEVAGIWLATGVDSSLNRYWCGVDSAGTKLSNAMTSVRRPAYLVPQ